MNYHRLTNFERIALAAIQKIKRTGPKAEARNPRKGLLHMQVRTEQ